MTQPYLRQVELLVGPLPEWKGGGDKKKAIRFYSTGLDTDTRISFEVHKHVVTTSSPTKILLYNLPEKLRDAIIDSEASIVLRVGWLNTKLVDLFSGTLLACTNERQGTEIVTTLISLSGWGSVSRALVSQTFSEGVKISDVVLSLARRLPNINIDEKQIVISGEKVGSQGMSFVGTVESSLNRLARVYGFSWFINEGSFYARDDKKAFEGGKVLISSENGFLLKVEPLLASPMQQQTGVNIESLLNPYVQPGRLVELKSGINKRLNKDYMVHTLSHRGDTHSSQWSTSIQSLIQTQ